MKRNRTLILLIFILLLVSSCEVPYSNPPTTFQDSDLVGIWETHYMEWGVDKLILKDDGTFKQIYHDNTTEDYVHETAWNKWWIERFSDGRMWLHLQGARYYLDGIKIAEQGGVSPFCLGAQPDCPRHFYDPVTEEYLEMVGKLVLNIRSNSSGEIILPHMWTAGDQGFSIIGGGEDFRRVDKP